MNACKLFSLFPPVREQWAGLTASVNAIKITPPPHRHAQRPLLQVILDLVKLTVKTRWSDTDSGELKSDVRDVYQKHMKFGHLHSPQPTDAQSLFLLDPVWSRFSQQKACPQAMEIAACSFIPVLAHTLIITQETQLRSSNWNKWRATETVHVLIVEWVLAFLNSSWVVKRSCSLGRKSTNWKIETKPKPLGVPAMLKSHRGGTIGAWIVKAWREKHS